MEGINQSVELAEAECRELISKVRPKLYASQLVCLKLCSDQF